MSTISKRNKNETFFKFSISKMPPKASKSPGTSKTKVAGGKSVDKGKSQQAPLPLAPIVWAECSVKEVDKKYCQDKEGILSAAGKWATIVDENGVLSRFLQHRDANMISTPDSQQMEPEVIRKALMGAIKFGKPFVIDMMETEMFDICVDQFDKIQPGLMDTILSKRICEPEVYISLYRPDEDDPDTYKNMFDYNVTGFHFIVVSQCAAPNEKLLQKTFPVKVV